jgi:hypothetical protein
LFHIHGSGFQKGCRVLTQSFKPHTYPSDISRATGQNSLQLRPYASDFFVARLCLQLKLQSKFGHALLRDDVGRIVFCVLAL